MPKPLKLLDKQQVHLNVVRLKKGGENFEIVVDPDLAIAYKFNKKIEIRDILKNEHIFADSKKGLHSSEEHIKIVFGKENNLEIAKKILEEGEIQLSQEYRQKLYEEKKRKIVDIIHTNGIDPVSGLPHPKTRIENAFEEAKIKIDYYKIAEDQVNDILKSIRTVLPIRFETRQIEIVIPVQYASKIYGQISTFGKILKDNWGMNGERFLTIEIPAGIQNEFYDKINSLTHGQTQTKVIK